MWFAKIGLRRRLFYDDYKIGKFRYLIQRIKKYRKSCKFWRLYRIFGKITY